MELRDYEDITLSSDKMSVDGEINISLTVKNTGDMRGASVVQLYIRDLIGSVVRPVKELKGFKKVFLDKGEQCKVTFNLPASALSFHDSQMNCVVEKGKFKLWIAESSDDIRNEFDFEIV